MKSRFISSSFILASIISAIALPASAEIGVGAGVNANVKVNTSAADVRMKGEVKANTNMNAGMRTSDENIQKMMEYGWERGSKEIDNRVENLTKLQARIQSMKNLSDAQKASFSLTIQTQITAINTLLAKIKADTSTTTLKADLQSIAPMYRIYMLIHPQLSILAATDRVNTVVGMMQTLGTKFDARLAVQANADASVKLADFKAKIADASVQSQAATALVVNLKPDNGDKAVMDANNAALKAARAKLKLANDDIHAANEDARAIVKILKASGSISATSTSSFRKDR